MEFWKEDFLSHYGVLGMRWGIRRYQPYSATGPRKDGKTGKEIGEARKASKRSRNDEIIAERKRNVKNRRTLSDTELDKQITRIRKENELKRLTEENISVGSGKLKKFFGPPISKAGSAVITGIGIYAGKKIVERIISKEAADMIKIPKK